MSDYQAAQALMNKGEEEVLHVALCREADDLRALHRMIGTKVGVEPWLYWDTLGVAPSSAVENLLALCGFAGQSPPVPEIRTLSQEQHDGVVPLLGFTLPATFFARVRQGIAAIANGQMGGFVPMVVAQSGFHDSAVDVFSYLRSHCGSPPIWVARPPFGPRGGGVDQPEQINSLVGEDRSLRASRFIRRAEGDTGD